MALSLNAETADLMGRHLIPWPSVARAIRARVAARWLMALVRERTRAELRHQLAVSEAQREALAAQREMVSRQAEAAEAAMVATPSPAAELLLSLPKMSRRRAAILDAAIGDVQRFEERGCPLSVPRGHAAHRPAVG